MTAGRRALNGLGSAIWAVLILIFGALVLIWRAIASALNAVGNYLLSLAKAAFKDKPLEFLTLVVATVTLWFLWAQLSDVRKTIETQVKALESQNRQLESQAYNSILEGLRDLDKTFIENAKYRPYFVDNRELSGKEDEESRQKIFALAEAMLDFMDGFYSQEKHIDWDTRYTREAWEKYFINSFNCSAVLRQAFCRVKDQYGHNLNELASKRWCDGEKPRASETPEKCKIE